MLQKFDKRTVGLTAAASDVLLVCRCDSGADTAPEILNPAWPRRDGADQAVAPGISMSARSFTRGGRSNVRHLSDWGNEIAQICRARLYLSGRAVQARPVAVIAVPDCSR